MKYSKLVLHVDDDPSILKLVAWKLKSHGVEVLSLSNPLVAIDAILKTGARIVIVDVDMPGKDGLTLLREIKHLDAGIQVIMCTGMVSLHTVLRATSLGAETCIFKPIVDLNEVTDAVDRAYDKCEIMWKALKNWLERKKLEGEQVPSTQDFEAQLVIDIQKMLEESPRYRAKTPILSSRAP